MNKKTKKSVVLTFPLGDQIREELYFGKKKLKFQDESPVDYLLKNPEAKKHILKNEK